MRSSRDTISYSKVTLGSIGFLIGMVVLYLYFLNVSVVQVVMRTEQIQKHNQLNSEISILEASYIQAQHTIANRIASLEGYNTNTPKIFVSRDQASFVFND